MIILKETYDIQPFALDPKIFLEENLRKNPSAKFKHFIDPEALFYNGGMFKSFLQQVHESGVQFLQNYDNLMKDYQILESEIRENSEYTFTGRDLSRMTGLDEADMTDLREHLQPFKRSFSLKEVTIDEAITLFFVYARFDSAESIFFDNYFKDITWF